MVTVLVIQKLPLVKPVIQLPTVTIVSKVLVKMVFAAALNALALAKLVTYQALWALAPMFRKASKIMIHAAEEKPVMAMAIA